MSHIVMYKNRPKSLICFDRIVVYIVTNSYNMIGWDLLITEGMK
jgi:hypothetical protein